MENNSHIIEYFKIIGLYGYKNITLEFKNKTSIFVSENGVGKTTIINILHDLLKLNFDSIYELPFDEIIIKFTKDSKEIKLSELDLENLCVTDFNFVDLVKKYKNMRLIDNNISGGKLYRLYAGILNYKKGELSDSKEFLDLYNPRSILYNKRTEASFEKDFISLKGALEGSVSQEIKLYFKSYIKYIYEMDILFMPTYRRLEKIPEEIRDVLEDVTLDSDSIFNEFGYGLNDVDDELDRLTGIIERKSIDEYRELSFTMLDDIINNEAENKKIEEHNIPKLDDLVRFLKRVRLSKGRSRKRIPSNRNGTEKLVKSISSIYNSNKISDHKYLMYFLSKLNMVIIETKEQEYKIEKFIEISNEYLLIAGGDKYIELNPNNFRVRVIDNYSNAIINFDELSSGEKQVITLMAKLYLSNNKKKMIIIDEPELSLSLKWQRKLLPDIDKVLIVNQVIAITHSPFIFDNNLECNATELIINKNGEN